MPEVAAAPAPAPAPAAAPAPAPAPAAPAPAPAAAKVTVRGVALVPQPDASTTLDMSGPVFALGVLVECAECDKHMLSPQQSPYLRCFHCGVVVRPAAGAPAPAPAAPPASAAPSPAPAPASALARAPAPAPAPSPPAEAAAAAGGGGASGPRGRQTLPDATTKILETAFLRAKAAEVRCSPPRDCR